MHATAENIFIGMARVGRGLCAGDEFSCARRLLSGVSPESRAAPLVPADPTVPGNVRFRNRNRFIHITSLQPGPETDDRAVVSAPRVYSRST